ncbi:MAG: DUF4136 domain-containing protein [Candidatus Acidiferrum sp.]
MELAKRAVSAGFMAAVLMGGLVLAGCDENIEVWRDPDVKVAKGMTWAWRPMTPPAAPAAKVKHDADDRPVISKDVLTPEPERHMESNRDWNTEANRNRLKEAIEQTLRSKGLAQVTDPATADFLVDYHVAVKTHRATVGTVYPGGYPGIACGPFGCWSGWGWGPPEVEYQAVRFHEGTFVLDLALRNPKKLAYRAISQKELNNKSTITPYQAEEAVKHLLKGLKVQ